MDETLVHKALARMKQSGGKKGRSTRRTIRLRAEESAPQSGAVPDIKALQQEVMDRRAETAMSTIKTIAGEFKQNAPASRAEGRLRLENEEDLRHFFFRTNPSARILKVTEHSVRFGAPRLARVPRLPEGYGYKGGTARLALLAVLGRHAGDLAPRDLDIVRIGPGSAEADQDIAAQYMPEDFRHGNGVEVVETLTGYFDSRDLTINEVLLTRSELICSRRALLDTISGTLRPTAHALAQPGGIEPLVALKLIRFNAEAACAGQDSKIEGLPPGITVKPFEVALHLRRALRSSREAAHAYLSEVLRRDMLPGQSPQGGAVDQLMRELLNQFKETPPALPKRRNLPRL